MVKQKFGMGAVLRSLGVAVAVVGSMMAFADGAGVSFSDVSVTSTAPGVATVSARVSGTGDVYAEYAHEKNPQTVRSVKSRYAQNGLIAMWDGEDNMGTGAHVAGSTTWRDLVGGHADMTFTSAPTLGVNVFMVRQANCPLVSSL